MEFLSKEELEKLPKEELEKMLEECEEKVKYFNTMQMTKKILINSLYGALTNKGFPFFNETIAQAITGNGRYFIQLVANNIEKKLQSILKNDKPYIVYGDTDSFYYHIEPIMDLIIQKHPNKTINEYVDLADKFEQSIVDPVIQESLKEFGDKLNCNDQSSMGCKREIIADSTMFVAKKKYIARVRDSEGVRFSEDDPYLKVMGLDLARSSMSVWCKEKLKESLNIILDGNENDLKVWIEKIKKEFCSLPIKNICIFGSVSKVDYDIYKDKGIPFMCKAGIYYNNYLEKNNLTNKYPQIENDTKVKLISLLEPNNFGTDRIAYITDNFEEEFRYFIDYDEQFKKGLLDPLNNMVKAIKYDIFRQTETLDEW